MTTINRIRNKLESNRGRSAWEKGVTLYALDLLAEYEENYGKSACAPCEIDLLNGANDWSHYSWGGASLCYDEDIAKRLCTPSELERTQQGFRRPNVREEWLDVQARALYQAARKILSAGYDVWLETTIEE